MSIHNRTFELSATAIPICSVARAEPELISTPSLHLIRKLYRLHHQIPDDAEEEELSNALVAARSNKEFMS